MADKTNIPWCDATWNIATGCTKISPGCKNCYMYRDYPRLKAMGQKSYQKTAFEVTLVPDQLEKPLHWKNSRKIFPCSMSDIMHEDIPDDYIANAVDIMACADWHDFLFLTKRSDRLVKFFHDVWPTYPRKYAYQHRHSSKVYQPATWPEKENAWPENVWLGASVENSDYLWRLDDLAQCPAAVRWVSYEPALGPVDLWKWLHCENCAGLGGKVALYDNGQLQRELCRTCQGKGRVLDWVVYGGESGRPPAPDIRAAHPYWFQTIRDQCVEAEVPQFFKQWGEHVPAPEEMNFAQAEAWAKGKPTIAYSSGHTMVRVGTKAAGAVLDGHQYQEFPEVRPAVASPLR